MQAMLVALLACALAGVTAVFVPSASGAGRMAGSAGIVVLACALLMPLSRPTDASRPSMAAMAWFAMVLGAVTLALTNIWDVVPPGTPRTVALTLLLAWIGYGIPVSMLLLAALRKAQAASDVRHPVAVACAVIGATVAFVGALVLELQSSLQPLSQRDFEFTPLAFTFTLVASMTGAANLVPFRRPAQPGRRAAIGKWVGAFGFACTLAALTLACALLEVNTHAARYTPNARMLVGPLQPHCIALAGAAISAAIWCPVSALGFRGWAAWLAPATTGITLAITVLLTLVSVDPATFGVGTDLIFRTCTALGIVDASALVTVALLSRFRRSEAGTDGFIQAVSGVDMRCPRCSTARFAALGESACKVCGLVVLLGVRDDSCPACGYDLQHASTDACPECGRARQMTATA